MNVTDIAGQDKRLLIWGAGDQGTVTLDCALAMKYYKTISFLEIKEKPGRQIPDIPDRVLAVGVPAVIKNR